MACHIRRDDMVEVISGAHKGAKGKVLKVNTKKNEVIVQGVNMVNRHVRPSRKNPQGGRLQKEAPIHMSNVLPVDDKANRGARVHFQTDRDDKGKVVNKQRVTVKGSTLHTLSKTSET